MSRHFILSSVLGAALLVLLGIFWMPAPPSGHGLMGSAAVALDYAAGWKGVGGPPWWTPNFLHGISFAPLNAHLASSAWLLGWIGLFGPLAAPKLAGLFCLFGGSLGVYFWSRRLAGDTRVASASALAFLLAPFPYVWLGSIESWPSVCALAVIPSVLWAATALVDRPSRLHGLLLGASLALLSLTSADAFAVILPLLVLYGGFLWRWRQASWRVPIGPLLIALAVLVVLGLIPRLPALREMPFALSFNDTQLAEWREVLSIKSNVLWFDRNGFLSSGLPPQFVSEAAQGGNYLGLIPAALLIAVLGLRPAALYSSDLGRLCRGLIGVALAAHWLSFGPHSILGGQLDFLHEALDVSDPVIALSWFLLLIQPWIICRLLPLNLRHRLAIGVVLSLVYLAIPGFRLISWLPIYSQMLAPQHFSQLGGVFFLVIATACALFLLIDRLPSRFPRKVAGGILILAVLLDISPFFQPFLQHSPDQTIFEDFKKAADFLASAPQPGAILPLDDLNYAMLLPQLAQRKITASSSDLFMMQKGIDFLQSTSQLSSSLLQAYLNIGGAAFVFVDKNHSGTSPEIINRLKFVLSPVFENAHFLVLENRAALAPAFLARDFVTGEAKPARIAYSALALEKLGIITLPPGPDTSEARPDNVGKIDDDGYRLDDGISKDTSAPFQPIAWSNPGLNNYQQIVLAPAGAPGWIVVPEAFHPDWLAFSKDGPLPVLQSEGAFLTVPAQPNQSVALVYSPPWWYNFCLYIPGLGWLGVLALIAAGTSPRAPRRLRHWLRHQSNSAATPILSQPKDRWPIKTALVLIPTYNEARNIPQIFDRIFAADPRAEVLIVDDNSQDGTQDIIRSHPEFGRKLHLLARPGKMGLGSAYKDGFQWAFQRDFDACVQMDADFSHNPDDIPRLLAALDGGVDAAIGSRYLGGVRVMNWPVHRLWLSTGATRYVNFMTKLPLTDVTSGFKALRTAALKQLDWRLFRAEGYGFQVELHYFLWREGAKLEEVPIVFTERRVGETKMTLHIAFEAAWRAAWLPYVRRTPPEKL